MSVAYIQQKGFISMQVKHSILGIREVVHLCSTIAIVASDTCLAGYPLYQPRVSGSLQRQTLLDGVHIRWDHLLFESIQFFPLIIE